MTKQYTLKYFKDKYVKLNTTVDLIRQKIWKMTKKTIAHNNVILWLNEKQQNIIITITIFIL